MSNKDPHRPGHEVQSKSTSDGVRGGSGANASVSHRLRLRLAQHCRLLCSNASAHLMIQRAQQYNINGLVPNRSLQKQKGSDENPKASRMESDAIQSTIQLGFKIHRQSTTPSKIRWGDRVTEALAAPPLTPTCILRRKPKGPGMNQM